MTFVLQNIRSAWNVGSAFRTADCLGADLILVGYTPRPVGASAKLIAKTAIGAEKYTPWIEYTHFQEVFESFSSHTHLSAEITTSSQSIFELLTLGLKGKDGDGLLESELLVWFGNEITGLESQILQQSDYVAHLPMSGQKESLNVSNSMSALGYLLKQWFFDSDTSNKVLSK